MVRTGSNRVFVGGAWLIGARAVDRLLGVISIVILARLLKPADFGIVAVAGTVVSAVELLNSFGFDWALVRHRELTTAHLNTAWTLRALFGVATFAILTLLGPVAAKFYRQPGLTPILALMGAASFIGSLANIGTVYFRRDFEFHKEFLLDFISNVIGFLITLAIAVAYRSYWALVAGIVALRVATTVASYFLHPFRPRSSLQTARELFSFSFWLLLGSVIEYCRERFSNLYLGRVYGPKPTGLFSIASEMAIVPVSEIAAPINRAAYSKYTEDARLNRSLGTSYVQLASMIWLIALPFTAGTISVANEAIALLLGPQWAGAEPVLRFLSLGMCFSVMASNTHYVYWALGHPRVVVGLGAVGGGLIVLLVPLASHFDGYRGVAIAFAIASAVIVPINFVLLRRIAGIAFRSLWSSVWRITLGSVLMLLALFEVFPQQRYSSAAAALYPFLLRTVVGIIVYTTIVIVTWLACGRPEGPESTTLELLSRNIPGTVRHWYRRCAKLIGLRI